MDKLISVIVPAYNVEPWIARCIESIIRQTYTNIEIIIIDDGSTDATSRIIDEYAEKDKRIVAIHQKNAGLVEVRNRGIEIATGEFVTFVDADDAIKTDMYERLLKNALEYDADISHCGVMFCYSNNNNEPHYDTGKIVIQNHFHGLKDLLEGRYIEPGVWNKLYKAEILKDSCLDKNILNNEDLLRNFVLFDRAKLSIYEDFCGYLYYQREGSMSKNQKRVVESNRQITRARKIIVEQCDEDIYPYAMQTWLSSMVNTVNSMIGNEDVEVKEYCKECRNILKRERRNLKYLIKRQQFAAWLIIISPVLHKIVYSLYKINSK